MDSTPPARAREFEDGIASRALTEAQRRRGIWMVTGATFALWLSLYFYVPFLPLRALDLGASNTMVGAVIAAYAIAQVGLRIPIGVGADLLGRRRPFALVALVAAAGGALWLAVSPSPWSLFLARALTGVAGAGWVAVSVLYASYFSEAETGRAMSRIMAVNSIGLVLATFVGGLLADALDPLATFYAGVMVGGLGVGMLLLAPEPPLERTQRYSRATFWEVARTPLLLTVSAIGIAVQFVSFATSFGFIPVYAERVGASSAAIGNLTTVMFATSVAGTIGAPWLARRVGYSRALGVGAALIAVSVGVVPWLDSVWALGASQALGGLGRGGMNAILITLSVLAVAPAQRATAMGVYQALYAIGMLSGPIVSGIVVDQASIEAVFVLSAAVSVLGGAVSLTARMPASEQP